MLTCTFRPRIAIAALGLALLLSQSRPAAASDIAVADIMALEQALTTVRPGDNLILGAGVWSDGKVVFTGQGTKEAPITLKAAKPGTAVFTGKSTLLISGEHLVVEGLWFKDPDPGVKSVIEVSAGAKSASHHCRLTNCAVISTLKAADAKGSHWLGLHGTGHRVDHCTFQGKSDSGTTFVVWLGEGSNGGHLIDHNYFGPRERLGRNGGETIRIGDSKTSLLSGGCLVEKNLFEQCNGEAECISSKSCGNTYRENTFLAVSGTLTLRHGNGCLVERNTFLGNGKPGTGGIRIIGEDHIVCGNYLENLTGDDARSAICLMVGVPQSPANGYFQVKRARVENNTLVDCENPFLIGLNDHPNATLPPVETTISGNQVRAPQRTLIAARCALEGITWKENVMSGKALGIPPRDGIRIGDPQVTPLPALTRAEVGTSW